MLAARSSRSNELTFDTETGELLHRGKNGLGNPIAQTMVWGTVGLTLLLAIGVGVWVYRTRGAYKLPR